MKKPAHLKDSLDNLLRKWETTHIKRGTAVKDAWWGCVGEQAKKKAKPVSLKKGVLTVIVEDSTWLYNLTLEKRRMMQKFNEKYTGRKKITDIRFRIGSLDE